MKRTLLLLSGMLAMIQAVFAEPVTTGKCGEQLTWTVSKSAGSSDYDVLTISGTGVMTDYQEETAPWYDDFGYDISQIVIEEGVTSIGTYAFFELFIYEVSLPNSLKTIRAHAFQDCEVLKTVRIGTGLTKIEADAFSGSKHIGVVYCDVPKASQLTWEGNSSTQQFMPSKATQFHVADAEEWHQRFPDANVSFVSGSVAISGTEIFQGTKTPFTCIFEEGSKMDVLGSFTFAFSSLHQSICHQA